MRTQPSVRDVCELFLQQAAAHPDSIAVFEEAHPVTYGELAELAHRVSLLVARHGIGAKVLVSLPQGSPAYAAMLGTLMGGGVYAPINTAAPKDRNALILESFMPDIILTDGQGVLDTSGCPDSVAVHDIRALPEAQGAPKIASYDRAYIIFTSGSTGKPKGVIILRSALNHYINWSMSALPMGPEDRCSQHPNIAFDLSVIDIYTALCSGATLYPIVKPIHRLMPARAVKEYALTTWVSVPSVIDLMIAVSQTDAAHLSSLRQIFFCGEPLLKTHLEALFGANDNVNIINAYGPTESTVSCTELRLFAKNYLDHCDTSVAIGPPIPGMEYALEGGEDENEGEIVLYGVQLAEGYWNAPAQTDAAFNVADDGRRAYHTGDWAIRKNGDIYFSQRIDRQIKIDGYRVELGEIDQIIREKTPVSVRSVAVKHEIHTFIETTKDCDVGSLAAYLRTKLPHYSLPKRIHTVETLPRNANDKIDDLALQSMVEIRSQES